MSNLLKSSQSVTKEIESRIQSESESSISALSIAGETNLRFRANLQSICEEGKAVLENYLEIYRSNGEAIAQLGDNFESIDSQHAEKLK